MIAKSKILLPCSTRLLFPVRVFIFIAVFYVIPVAFANNANPYIVKEGDTLSGIAKQFSIPYSKIDEISALNHINNKDLIFPGQEIHLGNFLHGEKTEPGAPLAKAPPETIIPEIKAETEEDSEKTPEESEEKPLEAKEAKIETSPAVSAGLKAKKKFNFKFDPDFDLGFGIGQSRIDIGSNTFNAAGQNLNIDMDEQSLHLQLFVLMSLSKNSGLELAVHNLGNYEFSGQLNSNQNIGSIQGELEYQTLSLSAHYKKSFSLFDSRFSAGVMQTKQTTSGNIDLIGNPPNSLSNSENAANPFVMLEAYREVYQSWSVGPAFSWIDSGDPIQSLSLRLSRRFY